MDHAPGDADLRIGILKTDLDKGIMFVVFELDIVVRPVAFDQVHLQDERLQFRLDHDPFDMVDMADQLPGLFRMAGIIDKIGFDPVAEVDGFSDVNDLVIFVFHQIAAGLFGQSRKGVADTFVYFDHLSSGNRDQGTGIRE